MLGRRGGHFSAVVGTNVAIGGQFGRLGAVLGASALRSALWWALCKGVGALATLERCGGHLLPYGGQLQMQCHVQCSGAVAGTMQSAQ